MTHFPLLISFEKPFMLKIVLEPEDIPSGKTFKVQLTRIDRATSHEIWQLASKMYNRGFLDGVRKKKLINSR